MARVIFILRYFVVQEPGSIRAQNRSGELPIHVACRRRFPPAVILFLVEQDPSTLHVTDSAGRLPVHWACQGPRPGYHVGLESIKYLIEDNYPDSVRARDGTGNLPVHIICGNALPYL